MLMKKMHASDIYEESEVVFKEYNTKCRDIYEESARLPMFSVLWLLPESSTSCGLDRIITISHSLLSTIQLYC